MSDEIAQKPLDDMAADLFERAARLYRDGRAPHAQVVGGIAMTLHKARRPDSEYVRALGFARVIDEDRRPAYNAIRRGEFPAHSLPARVEKMRSDAEDSVNANEECTHAYHEHKGAEEMACRVLDLLVPRASR